MRSRHVGVLVVLAALASGPRGGSPAAAEAPSDAVVARVGSAVITAQELEERLRTIPAFQLAAMGKNPDEIRRKVLDEVMIPEVLFTLGARARKLDQGLDVRERVDTVLRSARMEALRGEIAASPSVGPEQIARFYEQNKNRFDSPERFKIWRILCKTRDEASQVLDEAKRNGGPQRWSELAREHSLDRATAFRGGDLGLIAPDGASNEPSVKVDPGLFLAAAKVKDGELVNEPVAERDGFAVVWRRGSTPALRRSVDEEASAIRQVLTRQRLEQATRDLLKKLQDDKKVQKNPLLVDLVEIDSFGSVTQRTRPGALPRKPAGSPAPSVTPRGMR